MSMEGESSLLSGEEWMSTYYTYDTLSNLATVTQGAQTRSFSYDALSRLKTATNPESGTITFTYDANGNLATKTDARSITTTYAYDALNRVKTRVYSDSTPAVSYFYDNLTNAKGKLTKVSSSVSATEYTAFDILGRVTAHKQTTDSVQNVTAYAYNLSGALMEETYPSGRKVKNTLGVDGDLALVETQASAGSWQTRANNFTYSAAGAVTSMQLGNGRWESTQFNNRLQPTQIALGTAQNATDLLKLEYGYGTTDNNGNVQLQKITVPGITFPYWQTYAYDGLNRLQSATETNNSAQTWKQTFTYDRYGNRNFDVGGTTTLGGCTTAACNPTVSTANNRFSSGQGYTYDGAGNTTVDAQGRQFTYDAENKQTLVKDVSNVTLGTYHYDGDGRRVKKITATESIVFVYDAAGKLIEEYSGSSLQTAYVYAGSRLLSTETSSGTSYLTNDHLGSPRVNTDASGNVISRHDYHPFGEEIARTGYGSDAIRKQFTGYERDEETDLDFAQARIYSGNHGRFTTTDPIYFQNEMLIDPQRFNLYGYVRNNPLRFVDPLGMKLRISANGNAQQAMADMRALAGDFANNLSFDAVKDKSGNILYYEVSFDVTAKDIAGNEGAQLVFDLVGSANTFLAQRGGTVQRKFKDGKKKGQVEDVDVNREGGGNVTRNRPGPTGIFEPVDPEVDSVIFYPDDVVYVTLSTGEDVPPIRTFIHEAAESYLLAQGIEYYTAHGIYTYTSGRGKRAKIQQFPQDPRNAISRERAIAEQLKLPGGASGSSREGTIVDLKKKVTNK